MQFPACVLFQDHFYEFFGFYSKQKLKQETHSWVLKITSYPCFAPIKWCPGTELNRRHEDFQSSALPTELPGHERHYKSELISVKALKFFYGQNNKILNILQL